MKSKFVIFGAPADWCDIIYNDFTKNNEGLYIDGKMARTGIIGRALYSICYSKRVDIRLGRNIVKKSLFRLLDKCIKKKEIDLEYTIFHDWNRLAYDENYLHYLKKKYKNIKLIFIFTNIVENSGVVRFSTIDFVKRHYDLIIMYDKGNALKHDLVFYPTVYSKIDIKEEKEACDLFYVGNVKERYELIMKVFEELHHSGYKCCFFLNGVPEELQKYKDIIHYNTPLSYREVIEYVQTAKCILDVCQLGANAVTLRCCEAVVYNKKLITNASNIQHEDFYNPQSIYILDSNNIRGLKDFFDCNKIPSYDESNNRFASKKLLTFIEDRFTIEKNNKEK